MQELLHCYPTAFEEYFAYMAYLAICLKQQGCRTDSFTIKVGVGHCKTVEQAVYAKYSSIHHSAQDRQWCSPALVSWLHCLPFRFRGNPKLFTLGLQ